MTPSSKPLRNPKKATGVARADFALALGVIALGIAVGVGSFGIPFGAGYDRIGPRFFPSIVAAGLVLLGSALAVAASRGRRTGRVTGEATDFAHPTSRRALGFLAVALLLNLILFEGAGFVVAASALFWLAARGFGSERPVRDGLLALLLSTLVYAAFTQGLGLTLPLGIFERLF